MCLHTNFLANLLDTLKNPLFMRLSKRSGATTEIIPWMTVWAMVLSKGCPESGMPFRVSTIIWKAIGWSLRIPRGPSSWTADRADYSLIASSYFLRKTKRPVTSFSNHPFKMLMVRLSKGLPTQPSFLMCWRENIASYKLLGCYFTACSIKGHRSGTN